jgi:hypothetical protein
MSDEIKVNRPMTTIKSGEPIIPAAAERMQRPASKMPWLILGLVVLVVLAAGVLFRDKLFPNSNGAVKGTATKANYQAVFLTNEQVYFGKISDVTSDYVTLRDIYYLQVTQPQLQGSGDQATQQGQQPQISLVKLGNELHGPVDEMHINRSQVLFYEDLKDDSQVVKAIKDYANKPQ